MRDLKADLKRVHDVLKNDLFPEIRADVAKEWLSRAIEAEAEVSNSHQWEDHFLAQKLILDKELTQVKSELAALREENDQFQTQISRLERIKELARGSTKPELQQAITEYDLSSLKEGD